MAELEDAIKAGMSELGDIPDSDDQQTEEVVEPKSAKAPTPTAETGSTNSSEENDEDVEDDGELDPDTLKKAAALYKALDNPKTAKATLSFLYDTLGVELPEAPTNKKEVAEATKDIIDQMREAAPGLEFLIDKIGPIIKNELEKVRQDVKGEVEADRTERANDALKAKSAKALTDIAKDFNYDKGVIPDNILKQMTSLMDKLQPGPNLEPNEYLVMLHDAARRKLNVGAPTKPSSNGNGNGRKPNPTARIASERVTPTLSKAVPKQMTLNESILAAVETLAGGD